MRLVMKPGLRRDVRQGDVAGLQEPDGSLNTEPQDELVRWHADGAAKETRKVEGAGGRATLSGDAAQPVADLRVGAS
jgi:hypothetical protein